MFKSLILSLVVATGGIAVTKVSELGWTSYNTKVEQMSEQEQSLINEVHEMANSIIIAQDNLKYGEIEPTPERLDRVITQIDELEGWLEEKVLDDLKEWREGDFSSAVDVHNIIWKKLEGNVGKGLEVDEKAVETLKNKYDYTK